VLFLAARIGEAQVNELDAFFLDELENIGGRHEIPPLKLSLKLFVAAGA
jgi:hypothetical protein